MGININLFLKKNHNVLIHTKAIFYKTKTYLFVHNVYINKARINCKISDKFKKILLVLTLKSLLKIYIFTILYFERCAVWIVKYT